MAALAPACDSCGLQAKLQRVEVDRRTGLGMPWDAKLCAPCAKDYRQGGFWVRVA